MHILLYAPNLIGYARVILLVFSWFYALTDPVKFSIYYGLSYALDMADGFAARMLNQCSSFGALLDMVTDRISTALIYAILAQLYPDQAPIFYSLLALDLGSHWM